MKNKKILFAKSITPTDFTLGIFLDGKKQIRDFSVEKGKMADSFLNQIDNFLSENSLKVNDLSAIIVYEGPGSYTSLRVVISTLNTMAFSLDIPIYGYKQEEQVNDIFLKIKSGEKEKFTGPVKAFYQHNL